MAKIFAIFPLITVFLDYFENICIFIMLKTYPEITNLVVDFGSSFCFIYSFIIFSGISFISEGLAIFKIIGCLHFFNVLKY
ncbi:hypothetical protein BLM37_00015 [Candidatus Gracilibacteria bacterium GN02-873]|nr:hypothetical protein BLM37_00015 [Candidatus Gracilibacteria bacterium GN02-873]